MADHMEIERKYDVDGSGDIVIEGFAGPDGEVTADQPETVRLVADYLDTPALALAARGITLRRRRGGDDAGWHLKLPAAKDARREVHAPLGRSLHQVPARLARLVAGHVRGHDLVPVVTVETTRTLRRLRDRDGQVVAEVADDAVVGRRLKDGGQGEERSSEWREIEVELADGSAELLDAVEARLRRAGAVPAASGSKLARVLGEELAPASGQGSGQGSGRTAGDVLIAYIERQREQLLGYDPLVRLADHDDDSVHKMRVAVRRIRSVLRTHSRLLDGDRPEALEAELKWLADELGTVRDLEVLTARFARGLAGRPGGEWLAGMAEQERKARQSLDRTLLAPRYLALLDALDVFIADPPFNDRAGDKATRRTPRLVARSWRKVLARYARAERLHEGPERDDALHSTRKAAKRARYTAEAAAPVIGKPADKLAKQAERLQETLGRRHDAIVAQERLAEIASRPDLPGADAFTVGMLAGTERCEAAAALRDLPSTWKKASNPKLLRAIES
jgi:CHAD domain-containing protein